MNNSPETDAQGHGLVRGFGLLQATALNMSNMVGIGPFITIPTFLATLGGSQAMLGWCRYYQGRLVVDYMVMTFGQGNMNKLIRAYGRGLDTDTALKQVLNTDFDAMQSGFDQYVERTFGRLQKVLTVPKDADLGRATLDTLRTLARDNPQSYPVQEAFGLALRKAGSTDEAVQVFMLVDGRLDFVTFYVPECSVLFAPFTYPE